MNTVAPRLLLRSFLTRGSRYGLVIPRQPYLPPSMSSQQNTREQHHRQFLHSCLLFHDSWRFGDLLEHPVRSTTPSFPSAVHGVYGFPV